MEARETLPADAKPRPVWHQAWFWVAVAGGGCIFSLIALGLLATLVVPNVLQKFEFASRKKAEADILAIDSAVHEYALANGGKFPDDLTVLVVPDVNGRSFLDVTRLPRDPWGHDYVYERPGPGRPKPNVLSYGKDGRPGGEGDDADIESRSLRNRR